MTAAPKRTPRTPAPPRTLAALEKRIVTCTLCPRLREYCAQVATLKRRAYQSETYWGKPVPGFGDPAARLLLVGLAPGAHGANRTGRMFTGDSSGDWLFAALHQAGFANQPTSTARGDGLALRDVWIGAAGRCAPPDNKPEPAELAACRVHLQSELALLTNVRVVLALGRIGHEAYLRASGWWGRLAPRERPVFAHGAHAVLPDGMLLACTFHPSRQNTQTGRLTRAMWQDVFDRMRAHVDKLPPLPRPR
jgi:uracil-DNA glycosylase family 4